MAQELEEDARAAVATATFGDRVAAAVDAKRSQLLVGLDPRPELLPVELRGDIHRGRASAADAVGRFCRGLIDAVAPYVVGVKPQLAYFETLGADGMRAFEETCDYARAANLLVLADAKRGDIGSTARAYADAYLEEREDRPPPVDALTVNPYLGSDSIEPFVAACRRTGNGIFCLVKTSNAGSADIQDAALSDGRPVWHQVAELVDGWGAGSRRRAWALERRRRRRGDLSAGCGRSAEADAAGDPSPPGHRRPGRHSGRRRARLHERAGERARPRLARRHLRVPVDGADWRKAAAAEAARLRGEVWAVSGW